jgi:hypothetical protein
VATFCLVCGDPLGTRQLLHDAATCDPCRERAALARPTKAPGGLLRFIARQPLAGSGPLDPPEGPA